MARLSAVPSDEYHGEERNDQEGEDAEMEEEEMVEDEEGYWEDEEQDALRAAIRPLIPFGRREWARRTTTRALSREPSPPPADGDRASLWVGGVADALMRWAKAQRYAHNGKSNLSRGSLRVHEVRLWCDPPLLERARENVLHRKKRLRDAHRVRATVSIDALPEWTVALGHSGISSRGIAKPSWDVSAPISRSLPLFVLLEQP